jgi:hypothetical protein
MADSDESKFIPDYEEDIPSTPILGSTSKTGRKCPICPGQFTYVRRHVLREHLPWYAAPSSACWECELNFGCRNSLSLHIKLQHDNDPLGRIYDSAQHFTLLSSNLNNLLLKFRQEILVEFINTYSSFKICEGSVWAK